MGPPVAEVVEVDESRRQRGQPHAPLVGLVLVVPVVERYREDSRVGAVLVQVRVGPAERDLQHLVQLVQGDRGRDVDHPLHPGRDLAQGHPQPGGPHRTPPAPGAAQHFLYLRPEPHQHGSLRPGGQVITRVGSLHRSAAYRARSCAGSPSSWFSSRHAVYSAHLNGAIRIVVIPASYASRSRPSIRRQ